MPGLWERVACVLDGVVADGVARQRDLPFAVSIDRLSTAIKRATLARSFSRNQTVRAWMHLFFCIEQPQTPQALALQACPLLRSSF